jgi:quercetin dioxygenase-like cupin family protein
MPQKIFSAKENFVAGAPAGVRIQNFVSRECGATDFGTDLVTLSPGALLPEDERPGSEAITVLEGSATVVAGGRKHDLSPLDCIHVPGGMARSIRNENGKGLRLHVAHAVARPNCNVTLSESIRRFIDSPVYALSEGAAFYDLFARRFGAVGICGGYARFAPGSSLPCHYHDFDESISIVEGSAVCLVQGERYELSGCDTAYVPKHKPHRFLNLSDAPMAMIWVYAGDEPERSIVDAGYCSGELVWPGPR